MRETCPSRAVDCSVRMVLPPGARTAPRMKSAWPRCRCRSSFRIDSAVDWPVRSIASALLIAVMRSVLGDDQRVVGVVDRPELDGGIGVDELVGVLRSDAEGGDGLALADALARVVDDTLADQVDQTVGQELGVNAEVLLPAEGGHDRVRQAPVADLDRVAVLHDARDVPPDAAGESRRRRSRGTRAPARRRAPGSRCR